MMQNSTVLGVSNRITRPRFGTLTGFVLGDLDLGHKAEIKVLCRGLGLKVGVWV